MVRPVSSLFPMQKVLHSVWGALGYCALHNYSICMKLYDSPYAKEKSLGIGIIYPSHAPSSVTINNEKPWF